LTQANQAWEAPLPPNKII